MTATTKDPIAAVPAIQDFRPAGDRSADTRAAFRRLGDAWAANAAQIAELEQGCPQLLLHATPTEIARADDQLRKRRIFGEQLDVLEDELRALFTRQKKTEDDAEFDARRAAIDARAIEFNKALTAEYPKAAAAIVALLERERALLADYSGLAQMPAAGRKLAGLPSFTLEGGMLRVRVAPGAPGKSFASCVILPSVETGPRIWPKAAPGTAR